LTAWTTIRPPVYSATERIKGSGRFSRQRCLRQVMSPGKRARLLHRFIVAAAPASALLALLAAVIAAWLDKAAARAA
jgi:hypothetical protein